MMSPGRILENRGAAATLLELSVQRLNRAKNPPAWERRRALDVILPSQPYGVCRKSLPVALPDRSASVARGHHILQRIPGSGPASVLAGNPNPALLCRAKSGTVMIGMNIEERRKIAGAILEVVGIDNRYDT
jgi:hypothetical protein